MRPASLHLRHRPLTHAPLRLRNRHRHHHRVPLHLRRPMRLRSKRSQSGHPAPRAAAHVVAAAAEEAVRTRVSATCRRHLARGRRGCSRLRSRHSSL
jgi:hypothetical protein